MHKAFSKAIHLLDLKRYKEAREVIGELLTMYPDTAVPFLLMAQLCHREDKHEECIVAAESCLAIEPEMAEALYLNGISHCELERGAMGIRQIEEAIELEPEESSYKLGLVQVLIPMGYKRQADEMCRDVLYYDPENAYAFALLSYLAQEEGRRKEALSLGREALRLDPQDTGIKFLIGDLALKNNEADIGAALLSEAVLAYPDNLRLREKLIDAELTKKSHLYRGLVQSVNVLNRQGYATCIIGCLILLGIIGTFSKKANLPIRILLALVPMQMMLFWGMRVWGHYRYHRTEWGLYFRDFMNAQYATHLGMLLFSLSFLGYVVTEEFLWMGTAVAMAVLSLVVIVGKEAGTAYKAL